MNRCSIHTTITHSRKNKNPKFSFKVVVCGFLISASMLGSTVAPFYNVYADSAPSEPAWYQEYQENLKTVGGLLKISKDDAKNVSDDLKDGYLNDFAIKSVLENLQKVENMLNGGTFTPTEQSDLDYIYKVYQNLDLSKAVQDLNVEYSIFDAQKDVQDTKEVIQRLQGTPVSSNGVSWTAGLANFVQQNTNASFSDVSPSAWYYNEVTEAAKLGIINGMGDGTFSPDSNLTIAQAMMLAAKVHAIYHDNMAELTQYDNVEGAEWYSGAFAYARKYNLIDGYVILNNECTRQQMADMFAKVIDSNDFSSINDTSVLPTNLQNLKGGMTTLFKSGIFVGSSSGFRPNEGITRAETAAIILRITTPSKRVAVTSETYAPKAQTNPSSTTTVANTHYDLSTEAWKVQAQPKTVYVRPSDKYQSIQPKYSQPAEGLERIDTLYGGHTYGVNNQYEYDYVVREVKEAVARAQANPTYGMLDKYAQGYADSPIEGMAYFDTLTIAQGKNPARSNLESYILAFPGDKEMQLKAYSLVLNFSSVFQDLNSRMAPSVWSDNMSSSAYNWFVNPEKKDIACVGRANLVLAIYDVLGYNSATFGSNKRAHVDTGVQIAGEWYVPACGSLLSSIENRDFFMKHSNLCSVEMIKTQTSDLAVRIPSTVQ